VYRRAGVSASAKVEQASLPVQLEGDRRRRARIIQNGAFGGYILWVCRCPAWRRQNAYATSEPNSRRKTRT